MGRWLKFVATSLSFWGSVLLMACQAKKVSEHLNSRGQRTNEPEELPRRNCDCLDNRRPLSLGPESHGLVVETRSATILV